MNKDIKLFLASGCYFGLSPAFPGTVGALIGLGIALVLSLISNVIIQSFLCGVVIYLLFELNRKLTPWAQMFWNDKDPSHFVIDEIFGCVLSIFLSGIWFGGIHKMSIEIIICVFAAFRVTDVMKIYPADVLDRRDDHWGIIGDDMVAAMYVAVLSTIYEILFQFLRG